MRLHLLVGMGCALIASAAYGDSTVVDYKQFLARRTMKIQRQKKDCVQSLTGENGKGKPALAETIPFDKYIPKFVISSDFLVDYSNTNKDFDFLFASHLPPLSKYDVGSWSKEPDLHFASVFVLKTAKLGEDRASWTIQELRSQARLYSYTKVPLSQYFRIFRSVIDHVRALESFSQSVVYESAFLNNREAFSLRAPRQQLSAYVSSWTTVSGHEAAIKYFLEEFVANRYQFPEDPSDLRRFYTQLEQELLKYYPPDQVASVLFALRAPTD